MIRELSNFAHLFVQYAFRLSRNSIFRGSEALKSACDRLSDNKLASKESLKHGVREEWCEMHMLLTAIVVWLSANYGLPANYDFPRVETMSSTAMTNLRYQSLPTAQRHAMSVDQNQQMVSLYRNDKKAIYLLPEWTGRTPAELSVLVHEMVHHLQNLSHATFACPAEREKLAYQAQEKWLLQYGKSLESEFGLDGMSVLAKSLCD